MAGLHTDTSTPRVALVTRYRTILIANAKDEADTETY